MKSNNKTEVLEQRNSKVLLSSKPGTLVAAAIVIIIGGLLAGIFLLPKGERIDANGYQVVYMATGQAYFGKLQNTEGNYLVIDQPYTAQNVTPTTEAAPTNQQASTTLLKVSQQAYGPQDSISLSKDQVLFWQNLRSDSKVAKAIESKQ